MMADLTSAWSSISRGWRHVKPHTWRNSVYGPRHVTLAADVVAVYSVWRSQSTRAACPSGLLSCVCDWTIAPLMALTSSSWPALSRRSQWDCRERTTPEWRSPSGTGGPRKGTLIVHAEVVGHVSWRRMTLTWWCILKTGTSSVPSADLLPPSCVEALLEGPITRWTLPLHRNTSPVFDAMLTPRISEGPVLCRTWLLTLMRSVGAGGSSTPNSSTLINVLVNVPYQWSMLTAPPTTPSYRAWCAFTNLST